MKLILILIFGLVILSIVMVTVGKIINAQKYKICSKAGIQKTEYVTLGGIQQYIQIRGQDISNPVLIALHGGPGSSMASYSYYWQKYLEDDYTIVHWDQRGCGNTYYRCKEAASPTLDLLLSDLDELIEYICLAFGKEKVLIMGHSWGTFLGRIYSGKHPERVSAYIAVGQMLDFKRSEQISALEAARQADALGKTQDALEITKKLESIMAFQKFGKPEAAKLLKFRQQKEKYLPVQYNNKILFLRLFSPYMTFNDLKWMLCFDKLIETNSALYELLLSNEKPSVYDYTLPDEIPIILVSGDCDWTTPYCMALGYFNKISSPCKEFLTIQNAGHTPFIDKPEEFSQALVQALRGTAAYK